MKRLTLAAVGTILTAPFASARENYIDGFLNHWSNAFNSQSSIVMVALGVGVVGVFIITRSKSKK